jgi:cyclophilin family peptidyl-prolyl cis-trans isomerase
MVKILFRLFLGVLLLSIGLLSSSCGGAKVITMTAGDGTMIKFKETDTLPPLLADTSKKYTATIVTEKGDLVIELFAKDVPLTVSNFVYLATKGYYDGCTFHRVIPGFMAQGGDPTGTGSGGPGYYIPLEVSGHTHVTGAVSMAHAADPNSNGSQFFICYQAQPHLDGNYSVFGQLVEGMDVLLSLTPRDPTQNPQFEGDRIITITINEE